MSDRLWPSSSLITAYKRFNFITYRWAQQKGKTLFVQINQYQSCKSQFFSLSICPIRRCWLVLKWQAQMHVCLQTCVNSQKINESLTHSFIKIYFPWCDDETSSVIFSKCMGTASWHANTMCMLLDPFNVFLSKHRTPRKSHII